MVRSGTLFENILKEIDKKLPSVLASKAKEDEIIELLDILRISCLHDSELRKVHYKLVVWQSKLKSQDEQGLKSFLKLLESEFS